ncbi:SDR family NAD(P)-dependent oxidoreductase [Pseudomonas pudica]|uniref:Glucose 1-dehydrogenase n=1 Tax=Pseudomonas pudica TaxID=272772 RepID=A0ABS0FUH0_9PSED|nr:glucose 1-dehydrogenase [Pseudomonas pudica]MBF8644023.1 glucose 1-dehydrogenase [Pseudomonas pudica]MBF8758610.1 glucose 1-dehydrogenase [Pseudomonas pudica]
MKLENKNFIITGAAQGIGLGIAQRLASEGAAVGIADLNLKAAEGAAKQIEANGGRAVALAVDVTDREAVQQAIAQFVERFGRLDGYFNNAGMNVPMPFLDVTESNWDLILKVNGLGVLIGIQEAAKQMIKQGSGGKIVNTASIASRQGYADFAPYCSSKAAVISLTQAGARALADHGITVNGFAPGVVATPLWEKLDKDLMEMGASEKEGEAMEAFSQSILLKRTARPEDISGTALFLASADSDYITGQIIPIDGGMILV